MKNNYKGFEIHTKKDSHCAIIYKDGNLITCLSGNILNDGKNNAIDKAKKYIDSLTAK